MKEQLNIGSVARLLGWTLSGALSFLIVMTFVGNAFPQTLERMGLSWMYMPMGGIYADCSDPRNSKNGFCDELRRRSTAPVKTPGRIVPNKGKEIPFSLYGQ